MTEGQQDALPAVEQEPAGKPIPQVSGGSPEEGSAAAGPDASALAKELAELRTRLDKLPEEIDARFKSGKDKRFAKVDEIYEWVKASGGDPKKIEDRVERQVLLERLEALEKPESVQVGAHGGAADKDAESRTAKFLNDLKDESGVELTDEELGQIWGGRRYTNWDDAFRDARKPAFKKAKGETIVPAAVVAEGGRTAQVTGDLAEKYKSEMTAARGKGHAAGREIKAKYRKLGVDVDRIVLA